MTKQDPNTHGVYAISVAAQLVGTGQQNLRAYERRGLLEPGRTPGGTRQYSEKDLTTLRRIAELLALGLNLTGIRLVLDLENENTKLRANLLATAASPGRAHRPAGKKAHTTPDPGTIKTPPATGQGDPGEPASR